MKLVIFLFTFIIMEASRRAIHSKDGGNAVLLDALATTQNTHVASQIITKSTSEQANNTVPQLAKHSEAKRFHSKDAVFIHDRYNSLPLLDINLKYCQRPAKCLPLNYTTCMGSKLPYHFTTLDLTDLSSQEKVQEKLRLYQYLRYVPKCWAVIQPFLCALYMPKCENGIVDLPSREMCRIARGPCKILYNTTIFPEFMNCEDQRLFPSKCKNDIHEVKFNTTGFCIEPLVRTDQSEWFFPDVDGCGVQCRDVLYTEDEHQQIHKLMIYCVLLCIALNLFTIITFVIGWKTANKYPALAIFYVNVCFLISYCGWLAQFLGAETREDIVCKKDGTLRKHEPSANENLSCVSVFVMIYYFLIAGMVWFVIFTYAWNMSSLQALGKIQERVDKKRAYFHLVAWSLPLILTITTMALGEIDGDYVLGICFVGFVNPAARIGLLLAPLGATIITAGYIVIRGLLLLIRVKINSRDVISVHSSRKIRSNIVRMGVFALFMIVFCVITFSYHIYVFVSSKMWSRSLQQYVLCKLTSLSSDFSHCKAEVRPSVAMLQLQLLAVFGSGIAVASWVWCAATFHAWTRYIRRKFRCEVDEPMRFQKHKIIAQAFEKRKKFNEGRKISIECQHHTDPVGLHFDLNSAASNELSTTWAANLPRLVNRRGAVPNEAVTCSAASSNSEMSYSLQQISIESRRNSGESQVSVQISEVTAKINGRVRRNRVRRKRNVSQRFRHSHRMRRKCGSTASLDSQFVSTQLLNIFASDSKNAPPPPLPNLNKRRTANAGLDEQSFNNLLANAKLILPPYENNFQSEDDDENVSVTFSESKFNVVVNNRGGSINNLDLSDQLIVKSLRRDLCIKELNNSTCSMRGGAKELSYNTEGDNTDSDNSSTGPELKKLLQSSLNSADSITTNRASKQSKTSIDVAVQANAKEIVTQTAALCGKVQQNFRKNVSSDGGIHSRSTTAEGRKQNRTKRKSKKVKTKQNR